MRAALLLPVLLIAAPALAQAPAAREGAGLTPLGRALAGGADRALDAIPFWDRQDRSEPLASVLARVGAELTAAAQTDPEWARAVEGPLRELAERMAALPAPPQSVATVPPPAFAEAEPPRAFRDRPVWPGAAPATTLARRPAAPDTAFTGEAMEVAAAPPVRIAPAEAPAPAAAPAPARRAERRRAVVRSQPTVPPPPAVPADICAAPCAATPPYGLILGGYSTPELARQAWGALGQSAAASVAGLSPRVFAAPEANGVWLLAGPLVDRAAAERRCAAARAAGASCAPGRFEGEAL